jgi:predicted ATPase
MLTALGVGNFKAFGRTQRIPLKPLTLVFGPNSAGKSSVIHSLALAHEARRSGNLDIFRTDVGGTSIDLGGFRQ